MLWFGVNVYVHLRGMLWFAANLYVNLLGMHALERLPEVPGSAKREKQFHLIFKEKSNL